MENGRDEAIAMRLRCQQLLSPRFSKAEDVVAWMGMMQAQDYSQFRWAVGMRMKRPSLKDVNDSLSSGKIVRLHLLRCTIQTVAAEDYRWMLELCRDRNLSTIKSWPSYNKADFSEQYFQEATEALKAILSDKSLTKKRIGVEISKLGLPGDAAHIHQILLRGEIEGLLVSGSVQSSDATWTLAENILTRDMLSPTLSGGEALAALARKYFRSHSPASFKDFCWWTGLPVGKCRMALQLIAPELDEVKVMGQEMFAYKPQPAKGGFAVLQPQQAAIGKSVHLLPQYDEYLIGYKSRQLALEKHHEHRAHNRSGIFHPVVIYNGRVVGNWKSSFAQKAKEIETDIFAQKRKVGVKRLEKAKSTLQNFFD